MIARSDAQRRIRAALSSARHEARGLDFLAARLVDEIYGVVGDDDSIPRLGTFPYPGYDTDKDAA